MSLDTALLDTALPLPLGGEGEEGKEGGRPCTTATILDCDAFRPPPAADVAAAAAPTLVWRFALVILLGDDIGALGDFSFRRTF